MMLDDNYPIIKGNDNNNNNNNNDNSLLDIMIIIIYIYDLYRSVEDIISSSIISITKKMIYNVYIYMIYLIYRFTNNNYKIK